MEPKVAVSAPRYDQATSAKELFDMIGETVQKKVQGATRKYYAELHGDLSQARFEKAPDGQQTPAGACKLEYQYHTNVTDGHGREHPCRGKDTVRFSDTEGAQCANRKIRDNDKKNKGGACAPFRRLHLCDYNLENISDFDHINNDTLLADVCLAAKFEGESITRYRGQYQLTNPGFHTNICTVLARSFADIGDIIRGRDLYRRDKGEETKLEKKLKKIFGIIYNKLMQDLKNDKIRGKNKGNVTMEEAEERYKDDAKKNFYQLREDWWEANRETIWRALTCHAPESAKYKVIGADGSITESAMGKCGNVTGVPTNFDYVPQYLRWLHEWAEDFCRLRKHKLENAKEQCRGKNDSGKPKYCDRYGLDCERTKYKIGYFVEGEGCKKCTVACDRFVKWIDNQKQEFLKQKQKCENEISGGDGRRQKRSTHSTKEYKGYEKHFNEELRNEGKDVRSFLQLLSKEKICKERIQVGEEKANSVDFTESTVKTFSHTTYCQACPWCGVDCSSGNCTKNLDESCNEGTYNKPTDASNTTDIPKLTPEKGKKGILKKYETFCQNPDKKNEQIKNWECHYEQTDKSNICVLQKEKQDTEEQKVTSYYSFFYGSIIDMLNDSIDWRERLKSCINNETKACKNGCKNNCDCYKRWVEEKKKEFQGIKDYFRKQKDLLNDIGGGGDPGKIFEFYLNNNFLEDMKEAQGDPKVIEKFTELLQKENNLGTDDTTKTIIDEFLREEEQEAETCKETHKDDCKQQQEDTSPGPSPATGPSPRPRATDHDNVEDVDKNVEEEEEEEEDEDDEPEAEDLGEEAAKEEETVEGKGEDGADGQGPEEGSPATDTSVDVCDIVKTALTIDTLQEACPTKYVNGREKFPNWKCVPTSGDNTTTGSEGSERAGPSRRVRSADSGDTTGGSICIPPRRRRLYVGKLHNWAEKQSSQSQTGGGDSSSSSSSDSSSSSSSDTQVSGKESSESGDKDPKVELLKAFVESAAVETFFLWDRYKKEWEQRNKKSQDGLGGGLIRLDENITSTEDGEDPNPQQQLKEGKIPKEFKRQMFYTLGDYRDICVGVKEDVIKALKASGDTKIEDISEKIEEILKKQSSPPNSVTTRQTLWGDFAQDIWNGMVCALTYKTDTSSGEKPTQIEDLKTKLKEKLKKNGEQNGDYHYDTVKLKEENSETRPKTTGGDDPLNNPKLTQFVEIPTYFRWLHEWGSDFCGTRKRMLEKIKGDCKVEEDARGGKKCSGYGEDCNDQLPEDPSTFKDLWCQDCGKSCRSYRKWIERKGNEFTKQKGIYGQQKTDATSDNGNKYDSNFVEKLKQYASIDLLLQNLGACSKNNDNNKEDKLNFSQPDVTFRPATNCKPCSSFKIDCKSGKCDNSKGNGCDRKNSITASDIENGGNSTVLDMRASDDINSGNGNGFNGLEACREAHIFKGIRNEQWKCGNVCGYVVCKPKTSDGEKVNGQKDGEKHIITIRALLHRWLEYFLEDYNKIRKKLNLCTKNDKESSCKNKCEQKCKCVGQWVEKKKLEWKEIKNRLLEQYKNDTHSPINFNVKSSLNKFEGRTVLNKAIEPCPTLDKFEKSKDCAVDASSGKKDGKKRDVVVCLLDKLGEKANECKDLPSDTECSPLQQTPPLPDEEETEEENPNPAGNEKVGKQHPSFCPPTPPQPEDESGCEPPATQPKKPATTQPEAPEPAAAGGERQTPDALNPEKEAPTPEDTKEEHPSKPAPEPPPPLPSDNTSDILKTTIPFGIALALTSIALLFLKKKTKASVGNLFQILHIPKSDYDIPTLKSKNRYIPYASDKYKGRTYIYMEGDTSGDEKYAFMSDTTDVTSSESEYEELDINDIYVPGSPKYKTLIEVVLEPSGKLSGNTIPTSGNNTPSDTQNDIQNDGIPSSKITDNEWNTLKDEFISQYLQSEQPNDVPNDYTSGNSSTNTNITTMSRHNVEEKPFITSIHDRNLYTGEEYSYNVNMSTNSMDDIPINRDNNVYSGIDLINDTLSGNQHIDIYDEVLKRKENELFGTNHVKQTSIHSVAKLTNSDPIHNQLELFHTWLDRHRDMCEKWENHHERLAKLKEKWENETHSGDINSGIPSGNHVLNSDVSIQIDMNNPKTTNEFTYVDSNPNQVDDTYVDSNPDNSSMDTILDDLDKPFNEPYYYDMYDDDIYYDVNDHDTSTVDSNAMDVPSKVQIEMDVNTKLVKEKYPISDVWDI